MAATPHPSDTATVVPLQCLLPDERHTSTFIIAMPCANSEATCEQTVMRPGAGSIALVETKHVKPMAAISSHETRLMMDTCAGGSIFPRGFGQSATDDPTVAPGCQAMLPGSSGEYVLQVMCEGPLCGKVGETPRCVLVAMFGDGTLADGHCCESQGLRRRQSQCQIRMQRRCS